MTQRIAAVRNAVDAIEAGTETSVNDHLHFFKYFFSTNGSLETLNNMVEQSKNYAERLIAQSSVLERDRVRARKMANEILATSPSLARDRLLALEQLLEVHQEFLEGM